MRKHRGRCRARPAAGPGAPQGGHKLPGRRPPAKLCHPPTRAAGFPAGGLHTLLHSLPRAAWRPAGQRLDRPSGQGQPTACVPARMGPVLLSRSRGEASRHPVPSRHLLTGLPGPRVQRSCGLSGSYDWGQHLWGALLAFPARSQCQGRAWGQGRWGPRGTQSLLQAPPLLLPEWSCRSIRRWGGCPLLSRPILRGWTCRPAGTSPDDSGRPPLPSLVLTGRAGESGWGPGCEGKVGLGSGSRPPSEQAGRRLMPGSSAGLWLLSHLLRPPPVTSPRHAPARGHPCLDPGQQCPAAPTLPQGLHPPRSWNHGSAPV